MHIPDGFLAPPVWTTLGAVSAAAVGWIAREPKGGRKAEQAGELNEDASKWPVARASVAQASGASLEERDIPLMGVMGAFVFAVQMVNFPILGGTSGHLAGGALLAAVLGYRAAVLVMTAVVFLQALVFQDGGVLALGANIFNIAIAGVTVGVLPGWLFGKNRATLFAGAAASVMASSALAVGELWLSGISFPAPLVGIAALVFLTTGLVEAALPVACADAIDRLRPGRVQVTSSARSKRWHPVAAVATLVFLLVTAGVMLASDWPDGLERLAEGSGATEVPVLAAPMAGYQVAAVATPWASDMAAGFTGVALAGAACLALAYVMGRRSKQRST